MTESKGKSRKHVTVTGRKSRPKGRTRSETQRIGWSKGLSEEEIARPGSTLLSMLMQHASENGHQLQEMARELDVTSGYIHQLRKGTRQTGQISGKFATDCSYYLGVPRMTVLLASSQVKAEDVFENPHEMIAALPAALRFIQSNPKFGPLMPPEVFGLSPLLQLLIVSLFEAAENRVLLPGRQSMEEMATNIQEYAQKRASLMQQVAADRKAKKVDND